jgi:GT2 family glycosyltransferase
MQAWPDCARGSTAGSEVTGSTSPAKRAPKVVDLPQTPSLRVHSVIYGVSVEDVERSLTNLGRAVQLAQAAGDVGHVEVAYGDCSPAPMLDEATFGRFRELVKAQGIGELHYTFFNANLGSAAGHNRLLSDLGSDLVLILNPDTVVAPDLLSELVKAVRQPGVGLAEARQLPLEHPKDYDPVTGDTSWAATACALIPRFVATEVDGFDAATFFLYCDDVDFSWRIRLAGYRVVFVPSARLFHDKRLDMKGGWKVSLAEEYYSAEAALLLAYKYSRPDLVARWSRDLVNNGTQRQGDAVEEFRRRRGEGALPKPIDPEHAVGQFIRGNYAAHRF